MKEPDHKLLCGVIDDYRNNYIEYIFKDGRPNLKISRGERRE